MIKYSKDEILEWLSATLLLPGNEFYQQRFFFLLQLTLSIPDSKFKNNSISANGINSFLKITDFLDWSSIEDWKPIKNDIKNTFGLDGEIYNFLAGELDFPETLLECLVTRYFEFERVFKNKFRYSISKELKNILEYQTKIVRYIHKNKTNSKRYKNFILPNKKFVLGLQKILNTSPLFSKELWINNVERVTAPKSIDESYWFFLSSPIIKYRIYTPNILIYAFKLKTTEVLKKKMDEKLRIIIKKQLHNNIYLTLLEFVTWEGIVENFSIEDVSDEIDFGLISDNKFFLFFVIEDIYDDEELNKKIIKKAKIFNKVKPKFVKNKIEIEHNGHKEIINKKLDPIFIIILDELYDKNVVIEEKKAKKVFLLSVNCLRHVFEDLIDNGRDLIYLSKVFDKYIELFSTRRFFTFTFCDFYELISNIQHYEEGMIEIGFEDGKIGVLFADPHNWSKYERNYTLKRRPKIDLRPTNYPLPYTFKIIKLSEKVFFGYNNLLNKEFICFKDEIEIYILFNRTLFELEIEEDKDLELYQKSIITSFSYGMMNFIENYIINYLKILIDKRIIGHLPKSKFLIEIIPKDWAIKNNIIKSPSPNPFKINKKSKYEYVIILDQLGLIEKFSKNPKFILEKFFENIIQNIVTKNQYKEINEKLDKLDPSESFKITRYSSYSISSKKQLYYPTKMDYVDVQLDLLHYLKDKYSSGEYNGDQAKEIVNDAYIYLVNKIRDWIYKYDYEKLIKFSYSQVERSYNARKHDILFFRTTQDIKVNYDSEEILTEELIKLNNYSPSCRYILELAISLGISGSQQINQSDWQEIIPYANLILDLSTISDYLHYFSDYINIKLNIKLEKGLNFEIFIEDNPIERHMKSYISGLKKLDMLNFEYTREIKNKEYEELFHTPNKNDIKKSIRNVSKIFERGKLKKVNDKLEEFFGFRLVHYSMVLHTLTNLKTSHLDPNSSDLIIIDKNCLINLLQEKTDFEKKYIENVINFSTIFFEGGKGKIIEPWHVNTRMDRITIKPLININNEIIFCPESVIFAEENVRFQIVEGKWPYNKNLIHRSLLKSLNNLQQESSEEFEEEVHKELFKHSDFCQKNICSKGKNNKCLINVKEKCPGQIDALSIYLSKKLIIVWEAKNIGVKYGSRDLYNNLEKFLGIKDGYIINIQKKLEFIKNNKLKILDFFKVSDKKNWNVDYCFVLSKDSPIINILEKKYNIINYLDIKKSIKKFN